MCVWVVCGVGGREGRWPSERIEGQRIEEGESKEGSPFTLCMYLLR